MAYPLQYSFDVPIGIQHWKITLMLKTTEIIKDDQSVILRLDGNLSGASVEDLRQLLQRYREEKNKTVALDLSGVGFIDASALKFLAELKGQGMAMMNPSLFIKTMLGTVDTEDTNNHEKQD
jgi:anti-anti-sigma factor